MWRDVLALVMMQSQPFCHHKKSLHQQFSITLCEKTFSPSFGWKENFRADMTVFERKIFFFTRSLTNIRADDSLHTGNFHCQGSLLAYPSFAARRWLSVSAICRITVDCRPHFPNDIESSRQNVLHFADFFRIFFFSENFPSFLVLCVAIARGWKFKDQRKNFCWGFSFINFVLSAGICSPFALFRPWQRSKIFNMILASYPKRWQKLRAIFATHRCSVETFRSAKNSRESLFWDWEPRSIAS